MEWDNEDPGVLECFEKRVGVVKQTLFCCLAADCLFYRREMRRGDFSIEHRTMNVEY